MAAGVKVELEYSVLVQEHPGAAYQSFGPGEVEVPKWAAKQMGDHCFVDGDRGSAPAYAEPAPVNQVGSAAVSVGATSSGPSEDIQALIDAAVAKALAAAGSPSEDGGNDADDEPTDWSKSTVEELKAEIESRNADRDEDDHIVPAEPGNKPQLVDALEADDAAQADEA